MSKMTSTLYTLARLFRDIEVLFSGNTGKIGKRLVNKQIGKRIVRKLWWR